MHTRKTTLFAVAIGGMVTLGCAGDDESKSHDKAPAQAAPEMAMDMKMETDTPADSAAAPAGDQPDYADPDHWLCRPGRQDACSVDLSTTIVEADGTLSREEWQPNPDPPVDCFYVYPTVSLDPMPNSDLSAGPEETGVVAGQFARFGSQCRLYAPVYRQVTLTALRAGLSGMPMTADSALGYNDVVAAWNYYLEHDNNGRGVFLIGHSQGSFVLTQLIQEHLDKDPLENPFIAALLLGTTITVPPDQATGGTFKHIPLCRDSEETGCVITYASFRASSPPRPTSLFARSSDPNLVGGCTNPASLGGGSGELHAYLAAKGSVLASATTPAWVTPEQPIDTPYVSVPGLLSAECVSGDKGAYLAITVHGDPGDPRTDDIVGDVVTNGMVQPDWGLHLIDAHLAMGNLIDLVAAKAAFHVARAQAGAAQQP